MRSRPSWLPPEMDLSGDWTQTVRRLYAVFDADFRTGRPRFRGLDVWCNRQVLPGGEYEEAFWHLISKTDRQTGERLPDFARAARLGWCAPTILNADDDAVKVWDCAHTEDPEGRATRTRTYLWLEELDHAVVLEKMSRGSAGSKVDVAFLVTAFVVDHEHKRRQLRARYARRLD